MKLLFTILVIASLWPAHLGAQTRKDRFKEVTITKKDQSAFRSWIDVDQLFKKGELTSRDSVFRKSALAAISSIQVDSSLYFLKSIGNRNDSIAILSRAVEGKVSVYTPPLESGLEAVFAEKGGSTYEMRQKVFETDGKKFYKNEYRGFLQVFFSDCQEITKAMIDRTPFSERAIMNMVSRYNKSCGWEKTNRAKEYKAKFQFGVQAEGLFYNSTKGPDIFYLEGDRPASGFGLGLYARIDFARPRTPFFISELTYNHITGGGDINYFVYTIYPKYREVTQHHVFDIRELRNAYSVYFRVVRFGKSSLAAGGGILFQYQTKNNSTVTEGNKTTSSVKPEDKFGLSPIVNVLFNTGRISFGYQAVFMAIQLKGAEGLHMENKFFLQTRLSRK